jgi:hypothetical protein
VAQFSNPNSSALKRRRLRQRFSELAERAGDTIKFVVAAGGLVLVILVSIPWLNGPLGKIGISSSRAFSQDVLTIVVVSIFFDVRRLAENRAQPPRHFADPMDVYPILLERIRAINRKEEKELDVLGMTLYTAWPSIRFWLNRSEFTGWTLRFTALAANEASLASHVPSSWFGEARSNLNSVTQYAKAPATLERNVKLQAYEYDFMPSLHGYRLGNGDLFYSILYWDDNGLLSIDNYSYEFIPAEDISPSATAIRRVFQSWFERATQTPWSGNSP